MNDVEREMVNDPNVQRLHEELQTPLQNDGYDDVIEILNLCLESASEQ